MTAQAASLAPPSLAATPLAAPSIAAFALPGMPLAGVALVFGVYLPRFYVGLGAGFLAVSGAILAVRLIDMWLDPFLGLAMDRTNTAFGRYRPWMVISAPVLMLGLYKLLMPRGPVDGGYLTLWLLVAYAGVSMMTLATAAWAAVLAPAYHERSRLLGWTHGLAVVGSMSLLLLPVLTHGGVILGRAKSMPTIALILMLALPIAVAIGALGVRDPVGRAAERPRFDPKAYWNAVSRRSMWPLIVADFALTLGPGTTAPLYVYFFHDAKGFTIAEVSLLLICYIGATLFGAPFWGRVAQSFGKPRALQIACVSYGITQTILMALPRVWPGHTPLQALPTAVGMFAVGFCASAFVLLLRAMVADVADEVRLDRGQDLTALLYSMVTTTSKIGAVITVAIVFPILKLVGYNGAEGAVNTPSAIFGLEMCYLFAPILFVFIGACALFGYRLDARRHAEIRAALTSRGL